MNATREYCRTFSATTKHVIHPDSPDKTLCGYNVSAPCAETLRRNREFYYGLETCGRCEKSAVSRGLVEGPEIYREEKPRVIRYAERFNGVACIIDADYSSTLCGFGIGESDARTDTTGLKPCKSCGQRAAEDGYYHADDQAEAQA